MHPQTPEQGFLDRERQCAPWPQRQRALMAEFRQVLARCLESSPAYRELYAGTGVDPAELREPADLAGLPVLRMGRISQRQREHPPFGGFEPVGPEQPGRVFVNPGFIVQPAEAEYPETSWAEALAAAGVGPGDTLINSFSYHLWPYAFILDSSARGLGARVVPAGTGNAFMQVRIISRLAVNGFLGTPSFLNTLAQRAEAMGLGEPDDLPLSKAMVGAEPLPESLRRRLAERLGITVRQAYGTVLLGCLGYECGFGPGLHVPEGMLVEVVDPATGAPLGPGQAGEVVASQLRTGFPMLRLATGDLSLWSEEPCPCGRSGPVLRRVLGRLDQAVKVRGTFVHPWQLDELMAARPEVFKYQALVTREKERDRLDIQVELKEDAGDTGPLARELARQVQEHLNLKGEVQIVPRGSIPDFHGKIVDRRSWE